jgi:hypothetical protein
MHPKDEKKLKKEMMKMDSVRLADDMNPEYLFSRTHVDLLVQIAKGTLRTKKLARKELKKRGLNKDGLWDAHEFGIDR